jgi:hypothetical protein
VIEPRKNVECESKPMPSSAQKATSSKSLKWEEIDDSPGSKSTACTER